MEWWLRFLPRRMPLRDARSKLRKHYERILESGCAWEFIVAGECCYGCEPTQKCRWRRDQYSAASNGLRRCWSHPAFAKGGGRFGAVSRMEQFGARRRRYGSETWNATALV